jgi:RHS repeat-associated protein
VNLSNGTVTPKYQHTDALGSPVVTTKKGILPTDPPVVLSRMSYTPYGLPTLPMDGVGYTGHFMDVGTQLTYMQQRYYDPQIGRFLSTDPAAADHGKGFNRYRYADSNPYRFTDPDGRASFLAMFKSFIGMGGSSEAAPKQETSLKVAALAGEKVRGVSKAVKDRVPSRAEVAQRADKAAVNAARLKVVAVVAVQPEVAAPAGAISIAASGVALAAEPTPERLATFSLALSTYGVSRALGGLGHPIPANSVTVGVGVVEEAKIQTKPND